MSEAGTIPISAAGLYALRNNPDLADYFSGNSNRMAACRVMLELLRIPFPDWAVRGLQGRAANNRAMIAAFRADNPRERFPSAR